MIFNARLKYDSTSEYRYAMRKYFRDNPIF